MKIILEQQADGTWRAFCLGSVSPITWVVNGQPKPWRTPQEVKQDLEDFLDRPIEVVRTKALFT